MESLYKFLKEKRIEAGLSQHDVAISIGYTNRSSINRLENGGFVWNLEKFISFAYTLGYKPSELLAKYEKELYG